MVKRIAFVFASLLFVTSANGYTILHQHAIDGLYGGSALVADASGNLYGTTRNGGGANAGTLFRVRPDGSGYVILHSFGCFSPDGLEPTGDLALDATGSIYGVTFAGGANNHGTLYKIRTDGTAFRILHSFTYTDGGYDEGFPAGGVTLDDSGYLYGTTELGGLFGEGTLYKARQEDGSGFAVIRAFAGVLADGSPGGVLVYDHAGHLFGITGGGGTSYRGTIYRIGTDGGNMAVLHSFRADVSDGGFPTAGLAWDGAQTLYGATWGYPGGLYSIRTDGSSFRTLALQLAEPAGIPVLDGAGYVYCTTWYGGGPSYAGALLRIPTNGTGSTVLHAFHGAPTDAANPSGLLFVGGTLYGAANGGGAFNTGALYRIGADGADLSLVHSFAWLYGDGTLPAGPLAIDGAGNLYGTTRDGGTGFGGVAYRMKSDGSEYTLLRNFGAFGPSVPSSGLLLDGDGHMYGLTEYAGISSGAVYSLSVDGAELAVVYGFTGYEFGGAGEGLARGADGYLYGTTSGGEYSIIPAGAVFRVRPEGVGFEILHEFQPFSGDGKNPLGIPVVGEDGYLYGTTEYGGSSTFGSVYRMRTDGSGYSILHSFNAQPASADGYIPKGTLLLDGKDLYGTTSGGGAFGLGTVFRVRVDGTAYEVLHSFSGPPADGRAPVAGVILDFAGNLYGTTEFGGAADAGTVFTLRKKGKGNRYAILHAFAADGSDGSRPRAPLVLDASGRLYGTTTRGGVQDLGTEFMLPSLTRGKGVGAEAGDD